MFANLAALAPFEAVAGVASTAFGSLDGLVLEGSYQESGPSLVT